MKRDRIEPTNNSMTKGMRSQFVTASIKVADCDLEAHVQFESFFMPNNSKLIALEQIEPLIKTIRGQKVILDNDLARLYGVATKRLNEQVRRNIERFPDDFLFQLTEADSESLRSQFATLKTGRGRHAKYLPLAFTEHGAFMAATVLNSPQAIEMSVFVVRTFVKLRHLVLGHQELAAKLDQLERKVAGHDESIQQIVAAIRQLMAAPDPKPRSMGFHTIRKQPKSKN